MPHSELQRRDSGSGRNGLTHPFLKLCSVQLLVSLTRKLHKLRPTFPGAANIREVFILYTHSHTHTYLEGHGENLIIRHGQNSLTFKNS